jgi:flagellin
VTEANALLQTAEGAMSTVSDILTRMKELATQASSANAGTNIAKISAEYDTLVLEIDRVSTSTKYAGTALVDGSFSSGNTLNAGASTWDTAANVYDINVSNAAAGAYTVAYSAAIDRLTMTKGGVSEDETLTAGSQTVSFATFGISFKTTAVAVADTVGAAMAGVQTVTLGASSKDFQIGYNSSADNKIAVSIDSITSATLLVAAGNLSTAANAYTALGTIDSAISALGSSRAELGAYQNRLGYAASNLSITLENITAAESAIRDVDMAAEMTNFTKNQILVQAGTAMLAQANMAPQQVLSLLKG